MKKNKRIFLILFLCIGFMALQSMGIEGQIQKPKLSIQKLKVVKVQRWITAYQSQNKIGGSVEITYNGQPLSNWKVTVGGLTMNYSGSLYRLDPKSFSVQPGKQIKVVMTPPPGFWGNNPRIQITSRAALAPLIATSRFCRPSRLTYPADRARISLGGKTGNLKVTWVDTTKGTHQFRLYEVISRGNKRKILETQNIMAGPSVLIPNRLLRPNKAYQITLVQVCNSFKFNKKVASGSYLDLNVMIDSYFFTR